MQGKNQNLKNGIRVVLPLCLLGGVGVVHAMPGDNTGNAGGRTSSMAGALPSDQVRPDIPGLGQAVSNASLDHVRGGFDAGNGLMASFGLQEVTYINGVLAMSTNINIPDISQITQQQAADLASVLSGMNLVQNGPKNSAAPNNVSVVPNIAPVVPNIAPVVPNIAPVVPNNGTSPKFANPPSFASESGNTTAGLSALKDIVAASSQGNSDAASAIVQNSLSTASVASALSQSDALAKVIQNTLNNQSIQTFTTLNVSLNTLQVLRQMNLQSTLQSAQLLSLGH